MAGGGIGREVGEGVGGERCRSYGSSHPLHPGGPSEDSTTRRLPSGFCVRADCRPSTAYGRLAIESFLSEAIRSATRGGIKGPGELQLEAVRGGDTAAAARHRRRCACVGSWRGWRGG